MDNSLSPSYTLEDIQGVSTSLSSIYSANGANSAASTLWEKLNFENEQVLVGDEVQNKREACHSLSNNFSLCAGSTNTDNAKDIAISAAADYLADYISEPGSIANNILRAAIPIGASIGMGESIYEEGIENTTVGIGVKLSF